MEWWAVNLRTPGHRFCNTTRLVILGSLCCENSKCINEAAETAGIHLWLCAIVRVNTTLHNGLGKSYSSSLISKYEFVIDRNIDVTFNRWNTYISHDTPLTIELSYIDTGPGDISCTQKINM